MVVRVGRILSFSVCVGLWACGHTPTSQERMEQANESAHPHPAAYASDSFNLNYRSPPDRDVRAWDFFYKHCKLVGRDNPAPSRADWECTGPE